MYIMDFNKALNILGLTANYTEEELKKAYRRLITKYHPDKWEGKTEEEKKKVEEKAKEINAAKDFLENYKGQKTNNNFYKNTAYNYLVFLEAKSSFIKELNNYNLELREIMYKRIPKILHNTIETLLRKNKIYLDTIISIKNMEELNKKIITYKKEVCKELEHFIIEYCKEYNIFTNTSKLEKYSLKKLYEQLEKLRKEYSPDNSILDIIEEEYSLYAGYNAIKENIVKIKKQLLKEYKEGLYSEQEIKNKFGTKVLLEFKEYYRRLEVINKLKSLGYKEKEFRAIILLMEENITADKETFKKYEKIIINLIVEKETKGTIKTSISKFNIKEIPIYKNNKTIKKDYYIKHDKSEKPKYKIKKNI